MKYLISALLASILVCQLVMIGQLAKNEKTQLQLRHWAYANNEALNAIDNTIKRGY